jgi:SAM-dependent methyltransferase
LTRLVKFRIFGKTPIKAYLRLNRRLWNYIPASLAALGPMRSYGNFLHTLVRIQSDRGQLCHTFFLRNRPALELIRRLVERSPKADALRVAVLGCSTGAEAYSVAWRIRSARPDLKLILQAADISQQAVDVAKRGVYAPAALQITGTDIFDRMTEAEIEELFDRDGEVMTVKSWIRQEIEWHVGDVGESEILEILGPQDIVVANNFLCHMDAPAAERCLRNIARLVRPQGYLFVSGIDLDIRMKVAQDSGWNPLQELLEEIHDGDPRMGSSWPWNYSALEPLNKRRRDWRLRYAAAFQLVPLGEGPRICQAPLSNGDTEALLLQDDAVN